MIAANPKERTRFLRFAVVGAIGAVVDFGVFNLLAAVGVLPVWSSVVSFITAVVSNFIWNRFWTYPDSRSKSVSHQMGQFVLVSLIGLGIRTPLFAFLEKVWVDFFTHTLQIRFWLLTPRLMGHNLALACAIVVVMIWNFFVNRYWTYNDVD